MLPVGTIVEGHLTAGEVENKRRFVAVTVTVSEIHRSCHVPDFYEGNIVLVTTLASFYLGPIASRPALHDLLPLVVVTVDSFALGPMAAALLCRLYAVPFALL